MNEIWEGLYQAPALSPYYNLAYLAIFWIEKIAERSKSLNISIIFYIYYLVEELECFFNIWANIICPTLIIHPHPVSEIYELFSDSFRRLFKSIGNPDLYVIHAVDINF